MTDTERIREHSIYDIISKVYPADYKRKRGEDYWAKSPFVNERTPSFHVHVEKGLFKCFSSQIGGDAIKFVMEYEKLDFREAVNRIYELLGWEVSNENYDKRPGTRRWFSQFAHNELMKPVNLPILRYLMKERKLSLATLKSDRIGFISYATPIPQDKLQELVAAGLVSSDDTGRHYWFFGDRIILPYINVSGGVDGFTARVIPGSAAKAKYKNSSEDHGFNKGKALYGIHEARNASRQKKRVFMVEGQIDRAGLKEAGLLETLSHGGTALTLDQAKIFHSFDVDVIIWYDYDRAGTKATIKSIQTLLSIGCMPYVVKHLDTTGDPDEIRKREEDLEKYLEDHTYTVSQYMSMLFKRANSYQRPKVVRVMENVAKACLMQFMADSLMDEFKAQTGIKDELQVKIKEPIPLSKPNNFITVEAKILAHLFNYPDDLSTILSSLSPLYAFKDPGLNLIWNYLKKSEPIPTSIVHSDAHTHFVNMSIDNDIKLPDAAIRAVCHQLKMDWLQRRRNELTESVKSGEISPQEAVEQLNQLQAT